MRRGSLAALGIIPAILCLSCTTDHTRRGYLHTIAEGYARPPRPVIVVPGFGVTRLLDPVRNRYVWGTAHATVQRHFEEDLDLPVDAEGNVGHDRLVPSGYVGSRGPVNIGWQLTEGLRKFGRYIPEHDVFGFAYDWRLSARDNAVKLDALVERVRRESGADRIDLVTHSAGAIVALTYVKLGEGKSKVDHLVMIAPTLHGVVDAFRVMVRPERFLRRTLTTAMVATWPSVPELLPDDGHFLIGEDGRTLDRDLWSPEGWREVIHLDPRLDRAFARELANARALRDELRRQPMPPDIRVSIIAGDCVPTARRALMRGDGTFAFYPTELRPDERPLQSILFEPGDGTTPISSAAADAETALFCDGHQGIATDPNVQRAIIRTLREQQAR